MQAYLSDSRILETVLTDVYTHTLWETGRLLDSMGCQCQIKSHKTAAHEPNTASLFLPVIGYLCVPIINPTCLA